MASWEQSTPEPTMFTRRSRGNGELCTAGRGCSDCDLRERAAPPVTWHHLAGFARGVPSALHRCELDPRTCVPSSNASKHDLASCAQVAIVASSRGAAAMQGLRPNNWLELYQQPLERFNKVLQWGGKRQALDDKVLFAANRSFHARFRQETPHHVHVGFSRTPATYQHLVDCVRYCQMNLAL